MKSRKHFNYEPYIQDLAKYMAKRMTLKPFPKIKLSNKTQANLFIRTAFYDYGNSCITIYVKDRHPKDVLRSLAHELVHHSQNITGKMENGMIDTERVADGNDFLNALEEEAYMKGNMLFREWTETVDDCIIKDTVISPHMKKKFVLKEKKRR